MSYLTLAAGIPNFSKAVFSLWFRVPRESVVAAFGNSLPSGVEGFSMMQNVMPLVTFGRPQYNQNFQLIYEDIIHGAPPTDPPVVLVKPVGWAQHQPYEVDPSYIGLSCAADGTFYLEFHLQTADTGEYGSLLWFQTRLDYLPEPHTLPTPGDGKIGDGSYMSTIADGTYGIADAQPEWFHVSTSKRFEPDQWHHVLLSFDVGGALSIGPEHPSSECQLWYAIDDTDYRGWENMRNYRDEDDGLGPNTIVTYNIYRESGFGEGPYIVSNHFVPMPSGTVSGGVIPSNGGPLGLPAAARYVDAIFRVEMAELQIFTGVTLDTGVTSNRRAFVDSDGKPVNPTGTGDDPQGPGEKLLGKKPEILLHGNSKWQTGYNTGTLGISIGEDGTVTKLPSGQFTPVAGIEKFKPEPALEATTA
jgi:hypothetical protein